ncbi:MAG: T9SS type A sorting domain-containing protein, partial [Flavobacteriales bacterium]|nr:T9SS type A sorting domain-containing protein [Flavobacteriales bacterium]
GYNSSYGITESGNAYLGGVKVDMGLPEAEEECKVPRVLFVDNLIGQPIRDNNTGYVNRDILNDATKEQALINYCISNEIKYISIYRLGAMFDDYHALIHADVQADRNSAQAQLNAFIQDCHAAGIRVGYIADRDQHAMLDICMNYMGAFNYNVSGKFNYIQLEHEFWNTDNSDYNEILATGRTYLQNGVDSHFTSLFFEHKALLDTINFHKKSDGNIWNSLDYVAYFYNRVSGAIEHGANATQRKNKTTTLANMVDAIFTTYYQEYNSTNLGIDFLEPSTSSDPQLIDYRNRLSDFGSGQVHNIIPLFSAEYYDYASSPEVNCGKGKEPDGGGWYYYDYLGKYLDGPDFNTGYSGNDLNDVESQYISQHNTIYQSPPTGFSNISNVNVTAFAWYRYSCLQKKIGFLDKSRVTCPVYTSNPLRVSEPIINNFDLQVFPNPTSSTVYFNNQSKIYLTIYNQYGQTLFFRKNFDKNANFNLSDFKSGIYYFQAESEQFEVATYKIIKL